MLKKHRFQKYIPDFVHSIKNKLMLILLFTTLVPILMITIFTYRYTVQSLKDSAIEENRMLLTKGSENIEQFLTLINKATLTTYEVTSTNDSLVNLLKDDEIDKNRIHRSMNYIKNLVDYVEQVNLYKIGTNESYLFRNYLTSKAKTANAVSREDLSGPVDIEPPHDLYNYNTPHLINITDRYVFSFHRSLYDIPSTVVLGYLSIDVNMEALEYLSQDLYNPEFEEIYIVDNETGIVMYSSKNDNIGAAIPEDIMMDLKDVSGSYGELDDRLITSEPISITGVDWSIYKEIPFSYLYRTANELARITLWFTVFLIFVISIIAIYISIHFTSPIEKLIKSMAPIKKGNLDTKVTLDRQDEFGILSENYQSMIDSLNDMIKYKYHMEIVNKENQIKVLQSQINPHFFSNVLQAIGTEALKHHDMAIYQLLLKLGKMMNYTMDAKNIIVPLEQEISYCINYLELQKLRFQNAFDYHIEVQQKLNDFKVPRMVLQPIIENFFKHGFLKDGAENGQIKLLCRERGDWVFITVENNGRNIPEEDLQVLQTKLNASSFPEDQIGLLNISYRLKLYYPKSTIIHLENLIPHGVKVTIQIKREEGINDESLNS